MYRRERKNLRPADIFFFILGVILIAIVGNYAIKLGDKMAIVITRNIGFWIVMLVAFAFGLYRKLTNPGLFTWGELFWQILISSATITALFLLFFRTSVNLSDTEVWNGYVTKAEYYEEWTEEVDWESCSTDNDGNESCTTWTTDEYRMPEWYIKTTVGDLKIGPAIYARYVEKFGNQKKRNLNRVDQVSIGDGNMYYTTFDDEPKHAVPASTEHQYVNYLKASDSIRKASGNVSGFAKMLRPYPRVHGGEYGKIELDRLVNAGVRIEAVWEEALDRRLDEALMRLGVSKETNILVYLAPTEDRGFAHALEEHWVNGKKNDIIAVLGVTSFPKVDFAYIMAWTEVEQFKIELRDSIESLGNIANANTLADIIINQVSLPAAKGGYERTSMKDLGYLVDDIRLPWWCQLIIIAVGGIVSFFTSILMIYNEKTDD